MNLLLSTLGLMLFGMFYFSVYMTFEGVQVEYLFFALGFQIIAGQGFLMLILTFISKLWVKESIARQLSYVLQSQYLAKIFIFVILQSVSLTNQILIESPIFIVTMTFLLLILLGQLIVSRRSFGHLAQLGYQKFSYLKAMNPEEQVSLLDILKLTLATSSSAIALIGGLLCSASRSWFDQQYQVITLYFGSLENQYFKASMGTAVYPGFLSYALGIIFLRFIVRSSYFIHRKMQLLSIASSMQIMCFFVAALIGLCQFSDVLLRESAYGLVTLALQFSQSISFLTVFSLIGQREDMVQILGFQFGLLSTLLNGFELWILFAWFQTIPKTRKIFQGEIFIGFCLTFSILALIIIKLLTFSYQHRPNSRSRSLKINKKQSFDSLVYSSNQDTNNLRETQDSKDLD